MSTAPDHFAARPAGTVASLYQATLQQVAQSGSVVMGRLVQAARVVLQGQEAALRDLRERDNVSTAANQLRRFEPQLCLEYPKALLAAFASPGGSKKAAGLSVAEVQFDQLELMDEAQVQTSVTLARIQQLAMQVAQADLAELNTLVSSMQGLRAVRAEHNPLRPEVFVTALKEAVEQTQIAPAMQLLWFNAMAAALGPELRTLYADVCARLRKQGVVSVAYAVRGGSPAKAAAEPVRAASGAPAPAPAPVRRNDDALLTLDKLRRLLSGELAPQPSGSRLDQFASQFARQFENSGPAPDHATEFDATVPAALEALTEMKQVDRVVQTLQQRRMEDSAQVRPEQHSVEGQRLVMRSQARDVAQALSLEVVTLMVDNMAHDARLLEPVRQVIRNLEPPLSRLALVDPRFFTDKQHPARRLLQALTLRSMAFDSPMAQGFDAFLQQVQNTLAPLFRAPIEGAEVFETKLAILQQQWSQRDQAAEKDRQAAVEVLQHAEARNLLAEKIALGVENLPDAYRVPSVVLDFLCGPWAQVVAQARIKQGSGSAAADKYEALISALLWSAQAELARAHAAKLTRLVPRLLETLREGLETIHYPASRTSDFLDTLMTIHQQIFRSGMVPAAAPASAPLPSLPVVSPEASRAERQRPVLDDEPWIAPQEAMASNFVELQATPDEGLKPGESAAVEPSMGPEGVTLPDASLDSADFPLGSWVEMWSNNQWVRSQLTWASPHGTLFLFTGAFGTSHSMSRRSRDTLLARGKLRLLSGLAVDEGALDGVAQTAMRNSLDSVL
jgi:hypothetical protein